MDEPATCRDRDRGRVPSRLAVARTSLEEIASGLRAADRVALWEFSSEPRPLGSAAGGDGVRRAIARLSEPDGGTEIGLAIDAVLAGREAADVLIVTDGKSHALDIHAAARRGARFTVVLVGEDSLAANLGHLAVLTGGQVFVSSGADLAAVLGMAVAAMRAPRLRLAPAQGTAPELAEALSGGMRITARWSAAGVGEAVPADAAGRAVAAYAAWLALPGLDEAAAAALAEAEGIVCHLTSLVLVDEAGEAQQGVPAQRKVPLMTPGTARLAHMIPPDAMALPLTSPTADGAMFRRAGAGAEAASNRGAARLARAVLGSADAALLAAAARAVGL